MVWKPEQSVIDAIENKNRRIAKTLAPQSNPYLMQFFWGANSYSTTGEDGDSKLFIGISAVATAPFLLQPYPDVHMWHADGRTGLIIFGANMAYQVVSYNNASSSCFGSSYLRGRFYKYCEADMFVIGTQRSKKC